MINRDKALTVQIKGDSTELGSAVKKATRDLDSLKEHARKVGVEFGQALINGIKGLGLVLANEFRKAVEEGRQIQARASVSSVSPDLIRGGRAAFGRVGVENAFDSTLAAVGQARAEALAGEDRAVAAFGRYGVDFTQSLEAVFRQLAVNLRLLKAGVEDAAPLRLLLGAGAQEALYAFNNRAGLNLDRESGKLGFMGYRAGAWGDSVMEFLRGPTFSGPGGSFLPTVTASEEAAEKLRLSNKQALLGIEREELSAQKRINAARQEQAKLLEAAATEADPLKQARLEQRAIQIEAEVRRLYQELPAQQAGRRDRVGGAAYEADEFARRGLFVGGAGMQLSVLNQQLAKLDQAVSELRGMRDDNRLNWS